MPKSPAKPLALKTLDVETWPDFARLIEANNGVWGGCWCTWYHNDAAQTPAERREAKACRVRAGQAHAALVYRGVDCVGWCQFGSPAELPRIHNQRAYLATQQEPPGWRVTCFFVDKAHRGTGIAAAALRGAVDQIKALGGGRIEGYPDETSNRKVASGFLFNGTLSTFERLDFQRERKIGKHKWVAARIV